MRTELNVPVLSLEGMHDPATRAALAAALGQACRDSGFLQITNHPISPSLLKQVFATSAAMFALPLERKQALARNPQTNRGWDSFGGQDLSGAIGLGHDGVDKTTAAEKAAVNAEVGADTKEGWMVGPDGVGEDWEYWGRFGHGTNVLPDEDEVAGAKEVLKEYYEQILALSVELMKLVALSLNLPEDTFDAVCRKPAAAIRLLHYPPELGGMGAGEHTDFGFITLLATSGAPGLELHTPDGEWVAIEPAEGAFVVNVGDLLALYTGGEYKSSLHRVRNLSGVERYSIPFFMDGNSDILVEPTRGPMKGKVKGVTVESHLKNRFDASYFDATADAAMEAMKA